MGCESALKTLPHLRHFLAGSEPHDLPAVWGLGDGPSTHGPDIPTVQGLERLLASVGESTKERVFGTMRHSNSGFWAGVAQLAFGSVLEAVAGSCEFEKPGEHHPTDVASSWAERAVHAEIKFWDWAGAVPESEIWTQPLSAPGIEAAAEVVFARTFDRGNRRESGRGRTTQMKEHYEDAEHQLVVNDADHEAIRIAAVMTSMLTPGEYFEDVVRGEVMFLMDGDSLHEVRPYENHEQFEPTGLANRAFRDEIDIAVWFSFSLVYGFRGARTIGSDYENTAHLRSALQDELETRQSSSE